MSGTRPVARVRARGGVLLPNWIEDPVRHVDVVGMRVTARLEPGVPIEDADLESSDQITIGNLEERDHPGLAALDHRLFEMLGTTFADSPWTEDNYALPRAGKAELSYVARDGDQPVGAWIATATVPGDAHTHRILVSPDYRQRGLFQRLFCASWQATVRAGFRRMLGETQESNTRAIKAYRAIGMRIMTPAEAEEYLRARGRPDRLDGHVIVGDHGLRSVGIISTELHGLTRTSA